MTKQEFIYRCKVKVLTRSMMSGHRNIFKKIMRSDKSKLEKIALLKKEYSFSGFSGVSRGKKRKCFRGGCRSARGAEIYYFDEIGQDCTIYMTYSEIYDFLDKYYNKKRRK